jgi:aryl-alcohol dehydrogenase-like predicted oxidoreductase
VEIGAIAMAWVLRHPRVDAAIVGPRHAAHLETALASTRIDLSDDERLRLAALF